MEKIIRRGDILIFAVIALVGIAVFLLQRDVFGKQGEIVEVTQDGQVVAQLSLKEDQIYTTPDGSNIIEIKDSVVKMKKADCRDQICVHTKPLVNTSGSIVCLPNRVSVRILGAEEAGGLDAITE